GEFILLDFDVLDVLLAFGIGFFDSPFAAEAFEVAPHKRPRQRSHQTEDDKCAYDLFFHGLVVCCVGWGASAIPDAPLLVRLAGIAVKDLFGSCMLNQFVSIQKPGPN